MEQLKEYLAKLIAELEDAATIYERLENLISGYPFNEYDLHPARKRKDYS